MNGTQFNLPQNWAPTTIGQICTALQYGYTASASTEPCGPRFLRITDIQNGQVQWSSVPYCEIDDRQASKYELQTGDIVFARTGGTVGKSFLISSVPERAVFASYLIRLSAHSEINPKFLYYFFQSADYWEQIGLKKGGLQGNINATTLSSLELTVCPLSEQRRIVAKIDELFSELDAGIDNLKTARDQLCVYRQALLKNAFEGKLTTPWREKNADKLETVEHIFARIRTESEARYQAQWEDWKLAVEEWEAAGAVGKQPARPAKPSAALPIVDSAPAKLPCLPKGWAWTRLGFVAEISGGLTKNQKRNELPRRMKYLRVANVYSDQVKLNEVLEIGVTAEEARKTALEPGDLLIVEGNGSIEQIGRVAMWGGELPDCGHQNHLIRARVTTRSNPRFFLNFMLSPLGRKLIVKVASSTTGLHTLSTSKIFNLLVPVTTPTEEALVLTQIEEKLSNIDKLLEDIDEQTLRANLLRQAIFKKAFSGELVAQSPNDEPASAMLERIKAEKAGRQAKDYTNKREKAA
ncbi:restriction endonuclease subunit S [Mesorhizobium sp. M0830]|uniref:restriction endonuclease subunit S n=1 Tax=Mesorhizobium sp. M0830 TaxID=2957008 RepID=UPI0033352EFC